MDVELQSAGSLSCLSFQAASLHQLWKGWERASLQRSSAAWEWRGKWSRWQEWRKWKRFLLYHFNFSGCILNLTEETAFGEHWLDSRRLLNNVSMKKNDLARRKPLEISHGGNSNLRGRLCGRSRKTRLTWTLGTKAGRSSVQKKVETLFLSIEKCHLDVQQSFSQRLCWSWLRIALGREKRRTFWK